MEATKLTGKSSVKNENSQMLSIQTVLKVAYTMAKLTTQPDDALQPAVWLSMCDGITFKDYENIYLCTFDKVQNKSAKVTWLLAPKLA